MNKQSEILDEQIERYKKYGHRILSTTIYKKFMKEFKELNQLSNSEITIIHMAISNEKLVLKDIVKAIDLPKSTLTSMINRLEKKGYIKRITSEEDKRCYHLLVTDKGKEIEKQHLESEYYVYSHILKGLDSKLKREQFLSLVDEILENLEKEIK